MAKKTVTKSLTRSSKPIARTASRPSASKTRVLLVRQPVKSVRPSDQPDRTPVRLAIGVIGSIGAFALLTLMGYLGYRLGFAPAIRVPDLSATPGDGLTTAAMVIVGLPKFILAAGIEEPAWLMLGFALISVPAAGLGAARPLQPGGPKAPTAYVVFAVLGAVAAAMNGAALVWWTASSFRTGLIAELPFRPEQGADWLADLEVVAGLDALGVATAALWIVLVMRLPIPVWLRALSATATGLALAVMAVAMATTNAAAAQIGAPRSLCLIDDESAELQLIIGSTEHHTATAVVVKDSPVVELRNRPSIVAVVGKESLVEFLERHVAE